MPRGQKGLIPPNPYGDTGFMADDNQPYELASHGWTMHLVGAGLWLILGIYELYENLRQTALMIDPPDAGLPEGISSDTVFLAIVLAILFFILAAMALVWSVLIKWRILEPLGRKEYEYASRNIMMLAALGLLFGFVAGGILLWLSFARMKEVLRPRAPGAAEPATTYVAQATPICPTCGNPARFIHTNNRWHCDSCARYLLIM